MNNPYKKSWDVIETSAEGVDFVTSTNNTLDNAIVAATMQAAAHPDCEYRVSLYIKEKDMYHDLFQVVRNPEITISPIV